MKIILKNLTIPFINLISFYYLISCGLRLTLWIIYGIAGNVSIINIPQILIFGIIQDSIALIFLLLPLSIMQILPDKILYSKFSENILMITSYALLFGVLFLFPTEILFFDEFNARFNLVAVDYFAYPTEVFGNIWESYPIIWFVILFLAVSYFIWRLFWPRFSQFYANQRSWKYRFSQLFIHVIICALYLKFGSIDLFANNTNRVQSQITHNGILTFAEAFYTNSIDFNQYYTLLDNDNANKIMRKILAEKGGEFISNQSGNFQRHFNSKPDALGKMNVVIIGEESLGAQYIGALGDNRNLTPNFDALSKKGLLFENAFATAIRITTK